MPSTLRRTICIWHHIPRPRECVKMHYRLQELTGLVQDSQELILYAPRYYRASVDLCKTANMR